MKLSLITSSLIALGVAAPVFEGRTEPADLGSPVHILKRASEPAVEAPTLEARNTRPRLDFSPTTHRGHKREELEVADESESTVEARNTRPRLDFSPTTHRGHKREELEVADESESTIEARNTRPRLDFSPTTHRGHKREVEERGNQQPGNWRWNNDKNSENSQNTEPQTANVQINGGKSIPVPMGQLFVMNSNGPINTLTTDKGNCKAIQADADSASAFGAGFPFNSNGKSADSVIAKVQLFLWCLPGAFDPTVIRGPAA